MPPRRDYRFVFIVGASGSGTTLLTRILGTPETALALGGNYTTVREGEPGRELMEAFNKATAQLWDRHASQAEHAAALVGAPLLIDRLLNLPAYAGKTHIIYKRSTPFFKGDRHRPDVLDIFDLFDQPRVIILYRDPIASTHSSLRRGFAENLRRMAVICEERLTYLAAQVAALSPEQYRLIHYESFCADPGSYASELAAYCGFPEEAVRAAIADADVHPEKIDRWRQELAPGDAEFLVDFFSPRRLMQWASLLPRRRDAGGSALDEPVIQRSEDR